jgi:hypothetical protein
VAVHFVGDFRGLSLLARLVTSVALAVPARQRVPGALVS